MLTWFACATLCTYPELASLEFGGIAIVWSYGTRTTRFGWPKSSLVRARQAS